MMLKDFDCLIQIPEDGSERPSWDRPCGRARNASVCAACPSALHGCISSAGSKPDGTDGGTGLCNKWGYNTLDTLLEHVCLADKQPQRTCLALI